MRRRRARRTGVTHQVSVDTAYAGPRDDAVRASVVPGHKRCPDGLLPTSVRCLDRGMALQTEPTTATVTPSPALTLGLRLTAGLLWLSNVGWKVPPEFGRSEDGCSGLCRFVDEGAENGVIAPWSWLMGNVVSPNLSLFGYLTLLSSSRWRCSCCPAP